MSENTEHTPTPWGVTSEDRITITRADGRHIGNTASFAVDVQEQRANAVLIVEAVNNYARLQSENAELRKVLAELVELEQLKDAIGHMGMAEDLQDSRVPEYYKRKPIVWQAAKELLEKINQQNG